MIRLTVDQFEEFKRHHNPEVYSEVQMNAWIEGLKDTLVKAEVDELDEKEKSVVDEFNAEFTSFQKIQVISSPTKDDLHKGLKYDNFYIRERQVEFTEEIIKSEDNGLEKGRVGIYTDTSLNRKLGRVGAKYGQHKQKEGDSDSLKK